jgi:hypothetical protein
MHLLTYLVKSPHEDTYYFFCKWAKLKLVPDSKNGLTNQFNGLFYCERQYLYFNKLKVPTQIRYRNLVDPSNLKDYYLTIFCTN